MHSVRVTCRSFVYAPFTWDYKSSEINNSKEVTFVHVGGCNCYKYIAYNVFYIKLMIGCVTAACISSERMTVSQLFLQKIIKKIFSTAISRTF